MVHFERDSSMRDPLLVELADFSRPLKRSTTVTLGGGGADLGHAPREEFIGSTTAVNDVPVSIGIPVVKTDPGGVLEALSVAFWVTVSVGAFVGLLFAVQWYTVNDTIPLPKGANVRVLAKNCVTRFEPSPFNHSSVTVRSWVMLMQDFNWNLAPADRPALFHPYTWRPADNSASEEELFIRVVLQRDWTFFHCAITFHIADNFNFNRLDLRYIPADGYADISAGTTIRATESIRVQGLHAVIDFKSLESKRIFISLADGSVAFSLDGEKDTYDLATKDSVVVHSRTAPVSVESSAPLVISMSTESASRALLRSHGIKTNKIKAGGKKESLFMEATLWTEEWSRSLFGFWRVPVKFESEQSPIYVTTRQIGENGKNVGVMH